MTKVAKTLKHTILSCCEIPRATWEMLTSLDQELPEDAKANFHPHTVLALAEKLISTYDAPFGALEFRQRAAVAVAKLAAIDNHVLEMVIRNAESYAQMQHIDDAFPYSPNGFEVLGKINPHDESVTSFLRQIVEHDWGVAKWSAAQALQVAQASSECGSPQRHSHSAG